MSNKPSWVNVSTVNEGDSIATARLKQRVNSQKEYILSLEEVIREKNAELSRLDPHQISALQKRIDSQAKTITMFQKRLHTSKLLLSRYKNIIGALQQQLSHRGMEP